MAASCAIEPTRLRHPAHPAAQQPPVLRPPPAQTPPPGTRGAHAPRPPSLNPGRSSPRRPQPPAAPCDTRSGARKRPRQQKFRVAKLCKGKCQLPTPANVRLGTPPTTHDHSHPSRARDGSPHGTQRRRARLRQTIPPLESAQMRHLVVREAPARARHARAAPRAPPPTPTRPCGVASQCGGYARRSLGDVKRRKALAPRLPPAPQLRVGLLRGERFEGIT